MTKYFAQDTPQAGLERMMMSVPGFQKRGSGMMILSRFCYNPNPVPPWECAVHTCWRSFIRIPV